MGNYLGFHIEALGFGVPCSRGFLGIEQLKIN